MTVTYLTKKKWLDTIPAVIQKSDSTARPQVVNKEKLPKVWNLIHEYYKISGIPVVLNTSFNIHNEPIIENPLHAFTHLKNGIIDKLVIGDYVYENK
jgi:carbamoyltransferase